MSPVPFVAGPFCASCQVPVERYQIEFPKNPLNTDISIHGQCHGKTESVKLTAKQVLERPDIVLFRRKQGFDSHNLASRKVVIA